MSHNAWAGGTDEGDGTGSLLLSADAVILDGEAELDGAGFDCRGYGEVEGASCLLGG